MFEGVGNKDIISDKISFDFGASTAVAVGRGLENAGGLLELINVAGGEVPDVL